MEKENRRKKSENIVKGTVGAAMAGAAIPLPVADTVVISGAQIGMLSGIAVIYEQKIDSNILKGLLLTFGGAKVGEWAASLIKTTGAGNVIGIPMQMAIAGTITAMIGYGFINMLEKGLPITKENLKKEAKKEKERAKADVEKSKQTADELKEKYKHLEQICNLSAKYNEETETLVVDFNLDGFPKSNLNIYDADKKNVYSQKVDKNDSPLKLNKKFKKGKFLIGLDIQGIELFAKFIVR